MAGEVVVDALPYIDQGYDEPGVREAALAMVEEETRRYRPTKNYLEHLPPLNLNSFETEIMRNEYERMQQRQPMDVLSMKRYELPPPPAGKMTDIAAWTECVENSMAQLEHQATRICNLELMVEYGCEAWKSYLEIIVQLVTQSQKQFTKFKEIDSGDKLAAEEHADAGWREAPSAGSVVGRSREQELRDRTSVCSARKRNCHGQNGIEVIVYVKTVLSLSSRNHCACGVLQSLMNICNYKIVSSTCWRLLFTCFKM